MAAYEHQRGRDGGLEDAEKDARGEQRAVAVGRGGAGGRDTPEDDIGGEPFSGGESLKHDACVTELGCIFRTQIGGASKAEMRYRWGFLRRGRR